MVREGRGVDQPNLGEGVIGGEGKEACELHRVKAHLWVVLGCGEVLGGCGSTEQGGGGGGSAAARVLR